jgi:hypothetical protein
MHDDGYSAAPYHQLHVLHNQPHLDSGFSFAYIATMPPFIIIPLPNYTTRDPVSATYSQTELCQDEIYHPMRNFYIGNLYSDKAYIYFYLPNGTSEIIDAPVDIFGVSYQSIQYSFYWPYLV